MEYAILDITDIAVFNQLGAAAPDQPVVIRLSPLSDTKTCVTLAANPKVHAFLISPAEGIEAEELKAWAACLGDKPRWLASSSPRTIYEIHSLLEDLRGLNIEALYFDSADFLYQMGATAQEHVDYAKSVLSRAGEPYRLQLIESARAA